MANFKKVDPRQIMTEDYWMLVTSSKAEGSLICGSDYNTMTASWGGVGVLWGRPVAFIFIRPQRHTFPFIEENERLTLSFYDKQLHDALVYCGKYSGRDVDKAKECGLTPVYDIDENGRAVWFDEARIIVKAKKLYADYIKKEAFTDAAPLSVYPAEDFHKMYVCEITEVLMRE